MLTREYPPEVYGGAGVHVTELTRSLGEFCEVEVHCMGEPREGATVHNPDPLLASANPALQILSAELRMAASITSDQVVHSHTWYTGLAGHLTHLLDDIPHVLTAHSLEPSRPWKVEQLGGGYRVSSWSEYDAIKYADAVIAVSHKMKEEILKAYPAVRPDKVHVILNGIDTTLWHPVTDFQSTQKGSVLRAHGVDPDRPIVSFVGRVTRQKGVGHLLKAAYHFAPDVQLVLCAGAPDTPEIAEATAEAVKELQTQRDGVYWIQDMLPKAAVREVLSASTVFVCPSIYEPLGIVNLEAMACGTAVVASDVGGIPEVVVNGETGLLAHYDKARPEEFERELAAGVNALIHDIPQAEQLGKAGRLRAINDFSWREIARQTVHLYKSLLD